MLLYSNIHHDNVIYDTAHFRLITSSRLIRTMYDSLIVSFTIFTILVWTQYPSVPGGDSGELIAEACLGGTAHPPGYPLLTILSKMVLFFGDTIKNLVLKYGIFLEDDDDSRNYVEGLFPPARLVNTMCCFFGAASCYYLSESIRIYLSSKEVYYGKPNNEVETFHFHLQSLCGVIGGILFALSPLTWEYSRMAEVFALNNFLITLIVYLTVLVDTDVEVASNIEGGPQKQNPVPTKNYAMYGAFVSGLALANQHTATLFIIPIALYVSYDLYTKTPGDEKISLWLRSMTNLGICFIAGLSPYLYLIVASNVPTQGSWGDQTTVTGFFRHILRREYGTFSLAAGKFSSIEGSVIRWVVYIVNTCKQFTAFGIYLSVIGILCTVGKHGKEKEASRTGIVLFCAWLHYLFWWNGLFSNLPLSTEMSFEVQSRFYMQPNILICFFAGVGSYFFITNTFSIPKQFSVKSRGLIVKVLSKICYLIVFALILLRLNYFNNNEFMAPSNKEMIVHDYATAVLESLPQKSLLLSYSDLNWNPIRYLQTCEGRRTDVTHLSLQIIPYSWFERQKLKFYPQVNFPQIQDDVNTDRKTEGYFVYLSNLLEANLKNEAFEGGIYIEMQAILDMHLRTGGHFRNKFNIIPWGMLYRVLPKTDPGFSKLRTKWQPKSLYQLIQTKKIMKDHVTSKLNGGSWEFGAMSVFWNMHYQSALNTLETALSLSQPIKKNHNLLPFYVDSLSVSSKLLSQVAAVHKKQKGLVE